MQKTDFYIDFHKEFSFSPKTPWFSSLTKFLDLRCLKSEGIVRSAIKPICKTKCKPQQYQKSSDTKLKQYRTVAKDFIHDTSLLVLVAAIDPVYRNKFLSLELKISLPRKSGDGWLTEHCPTDKSSKTMRAFSSVGFHF